MASAATKSFDGDVPIKRPLVQFPADIWGDRFDHFTEEDNEKMQSYAIDIEPLKEQVLMMLMDDTMDMEKKINLIDQVERLGISYYFEDKINELVDHIFNEFARENFKNQLDYDLYDIALQFRIFRQHGYNMPCDVFHKFVTGEGKFKETVKADVKGILSLYEAAFLRVHGEYILDEALVFTTNILNSIDMSSEQARYALKQPLHRGIQRLQTQRFISFYEEDVSRNEKLLQLAKIEFNRLQLLHRQELSHFQKWWKSFDFVKRLPHMRQRSVESYFWTIAEYHEPRYTFARRLYSKAIAVFFALDDTYDAYGTFEELQILTEAFQRWDLSLVEQLPEDYMKFLYTFVINTCNEFTKEMIVREKPFAGHLFKEHILKFIRNYFLEAEWVESKYVPTYKEYMVNGRVTAGVQVCVAISLMGMDEVAEEKPYIQLLQSPKAVEACEYITRLMDDIVTGEAELARGCRLATSVECYMKDHNKSREQVLQIFNKKIEDSWKDLVQEGLSVNPTLDDYDHFSKPVYDRILNYGRIIDVVYKVADGCTLSESTIKDDIIITYSQPFPI